MDVEEENFVNDIKVNEKFNHIKGFKQIEFSINSNNLAVKSFDKETLTSSKENLKNKFTSESVEIESIYEEMDTSFFNVDERPVKQTYILKNLLDNKKDIKLNILYEIDSDFVIWNGTEYAITDEPIYFKAFEITEEIFPDLNETHLTGHTLYFGNNYYDFKDVVDLDYIVSVYSLNGKNYIDLEINSEVEGLSEFVVDPVIGWTSHNISTSANSTRSVFAIDIDKDNDIDVLSASYWDNKIAWYESDLIKGDLSIQEIIPIQVVPDVDLVNGKTTLVRAKIKNNANENKNINVTLYFEDVLKNSKIDSINANSEKNVDLWFVPDVAGNNKEIKVNVEEI